MYADAARLVEGLFGEIAAAVVFIQRVVEVLLLRVVNVPARDIAVIVVIPAFITGDIAVFILHGGHRAVNGRLIAAGAQQYGGQDAHDQQDRR